VFEPLAGTNNKTQRGGIYMKKWTIWAGVVIFLLFSVSMCFASSTPIVFVHGFSGKTKTNFNTQIKWFKNAGWPSEYLHAYDYYSLDGVVNAAYRLQTEVDYVLQNTGQNSVDIVAHSMGGLVTRYYMNNLGGASKIRRVITLGTPHKGTTWAYTCGFMQSCLDMQPGSDFLENLVGGCAGAYSFWSACDEIVIPQTSGYCDTFRWKTPCLGHLSMCWNWTVFAKMRDYLL